MIGVSLSALNRVVFWGVPVSDVAQVLVSFLGGIYPWLLQRRHRLSIVNILEEIEPNLTGIHSELIG